MSNAGNNLREGMIGRGSPLKVFLKLKKRGSGSMIVRKKEIAQKTHPWHHY